MEFLSRIVRFFNNILLYYILIALLLGLGIYFTIGTKFVQIR
jgi:alanine or glycine:cation symporter, AGCS family